MSAASSPAVSLVGEGRDLLGESPLWDARQHALYWVDSRRRLVQCRVEGQALQSWTVPSEVGAIALTPDIHTLLLALEAEFAWLDLPTGTVRSLTPVKHGQPAMRMNDGRTDREGRFVGGSMVLHRRDADAALYRLEHDGHLTTLREGIAVTNATCTSPDGRTLYSGDSIAGVIRAWDYDVGGRLSGERVFADTRNAGSPPDGATVDAQGCLWVALVLAAKVAQYSPEGRLLRCLDVPVPYPTCPCFAGPALDTLYVTSIRSTGNKLHSDHPDAGAIVKLEGLGVRGLPETPYRPASGELA